MSDEELRCKVCGGSGETLSLERCKFCFQYYCADCAVRFSGRRFCSTVCGHGFFSGDEDEREPGFEYGDV